MKGWELNAHWGSVEGLVEFALGGFRKTATAESGSVLHGFSRVGAIIYCHKKGHGCQDLVVALCFPAVSSNQSPHDAGC